MSPAWSTAVSAVWRGGVSPAPTREIRNNKRDARLPHSQDGCVPSVLPNPFGEGDVAGFEIELGFGWSAEDFGAGVIEFAFPSRDDDCGETVADQVYAGAAHVH